MLITKHMEQNKEGLSMERIYKTMRNAGALNIAVGVVITVIGLAVGIMSIINGAVLLKRKSEITF